MKIEEPEELHIVSKAQCTCFSRPNNYQLPPLWQPLGSSPFAFFDLRAFEPCLDSLRLRHPAADDAFPG